MNTLGPSYFIVTAQTQRIHSTLASLTDVTETRRMHDPLPHCHRTEIQRIHSPHTSLRRPRHKEFTQFRTSLLYDKDTKNTLAPQLHRHRTVS